LITGAGYNVVSGFFFIQSNIKGENGSLTRGRGKGAENPIFRLADFTYPQPDREV